MLVALEEKMAEETGLALDLWRDWETEYLLMTAEAMYSEREN
jgi:hypothetical protein